MPGGTNSQVRIDAAYRCALADRLCLWPRPAACWEQFAFSGPTQWRGTSRSGSRRTPNLRLTTPNRPQPAA